MQTSKTCLISILIIVVGIWVSNAIAQQQKTDNLLLAVASSYAANTNSRLDNLTNSINTISMLAEEANVKKLQFILGQLALSEVSVQTIEIYNRQGLVLNINIADRAYKRFKTGQYPIGPLVSGNLEPAKKISITLAEYQPFDNRATAQINIPTFVGENIFVAQVSFDLSFLRLNHPLPENSPWSLNIIESTGRTLFSLGALEQGKFFDKNKLCHNRFSICVPGQSKLVSQTSISPYAPWTVVAIAPAATWPFYLLALFICTLSTMVLMQQLRKNTSVTSARSQSVHKRHAA